MSRYLLCCALDNRQKIVAFYVNYREGNSIGFSGLYNPRTPPIRTPTAVEKNGQQTKVSQIFDNNPQGTRLRGRPKTDGGTVYVKILINA